MGSFNAHAFPSPQAKSDGCWRLIVMASLEWAATTRSTTLLLSRFDTNY